MVANLRWSCRGVVAVLCVALLFGRPPVGTAYAAVLQVQIVDSEGGRTVPARVRLRDAAGADHVPDDVIRVPLGPDEWFVSSGRTEIELAAGRWGIRGEVLVTRGLKMPCDNSRNCRELSRSSQLGKRLGFSPK